MADPRSQLAPLSDATTRNIRVEVLARYSSENSQPAHGKWVFQYTVRITNQGEETVQLMSRHWIITDATGQVNEVKGEGVVGHQPMMAAGESFKYSSWCPLETPFGSMHGSYQMAGADGSEFDVEIAPFALRAPFTVN